MGCHYSFVWVSVFPNTFCNASDLRVSAWVDMVEIIVPMLAWSKHRNINQYLQQFMPREPHQSAWMSIYVICRSQFTFQIRISIQSFLERLCVKGPCGLCRFCKSFHQNSPLGDSGVSFHDLRRSFSSLLAIGPPPLRLHPTSCWMMPACPFNRRV